MPSQEDGFWVSPADYDGHAIASLPTHESMDELCRFLKTQPQDLRAKAVLSAKLGLQCYVVQLGRDVQ